MEPVLRSPALSGRPVVLPPSRMHAGIILRLNFAQRNDWRVGIYMHAQPLFAGRPWQVSAAGLATNVPPCSVFQRFKNGCLGKVCVLYW
jgi:hypothetical protein